MSKYLRFVGIIELIGFIVGLICAFIAMINSFASNSPNALYSLLIFIAVLVFGPAVGFLFLSVGSLLESENTRLQEEADKREKERKQVIAVPDNEDNFTSDIEKKALIAKHNYDRHLSQRDIEELMKLSLDELKSVLEKEDEK